MPLAAGTRLGPYEILGPLGAGGMGEVYRAQDSRLGRNVAIKVLPQHLSASPETRARFEREARTISALNHPHICVLHDVGREGDTDYLVMELVEGETLAQRLARGPLPVADLLRLGAQIADALDRAHRAGVIHRDLKPGNVMLTRSGAKLLDFGLARASALAGPASGSAATLAAQTRSPTVAQPLTAEGTLVGTYQYMSPEQLEGREADARADLWSLGCVLYEMATGHRAFDGATQASLISSIMRDAPRAMTELAPMSPPSLERLVRQCLAKDPDDRWQSAGDVRRELEWIASGATPSGTFTAGGGPGPRQRRGLPAGAPGLIVGGAIAVAALLVAFGPWFRRAPAASLMRFELSSPPGTLLDGPAEAELSPDGRMVVFTASDSLGVPRIYVRPLASRDPRPVPGTEHGSLPFWSPDSRQIGFFSEGKLRKVSLEGGAPVALCDAPDGRGGAWSPAGEIIFAPGNQGPLSRVSSLGGDPVVITALDKSSHERGHRYPQFLPDGRHFLYTVIGSGDGNVTYATTLAGQPRVEVCRGGSGARYAAPGWLLYLDSGVASTQRRLLARRFDASSMKASGDAQLLIDRVNSTNFGYANVTTNAAGVLVAQHWEDYHSRLTWRGRRGAMLGPAVDDFVGQAPSLSPDGRFLAYDNADVGDLFVRDLETGVATRLTFNHHAVGNIQWSWDGRRIVFSRLSQEHGWEVYAKSADGQGRDSLVFRGPGLMSFASGWSHDGRWLVATCVDSTGQADLWRVSMAGDGPPEIYQRTPEVESGASLSPDGHWLSYLALQGGKQSAFVQSFPGPGAKYEVSIEGVVGIGWSRNGDALIAGTEKGDVVSMAVTTAGGFRQGATTRLLTIPRGDFFVGIVPGEQRFLLGTPKDVSANNLLEIVLGWPRLLDQPR